MKQDFEAVVVGLGPAGMSAADALAANGIKTAVIDDQPAPGGQVYRQPPALFGEPSRKISRRTDTAGARLLARLKRIGPNVSFFPRASIYGCFNDHELAVVQDDELLDIGFRKLIICEGALERTIPFPGWTLPGVMTAGGLQRLLKQQGVLAGRRILLAGSGPLLVLVAAGLAAAGASRVWLCEAAPVGETLRFIPAVLRHRAIWPEVAACLPPFWQRRVHLRQPWGILRATGSHRVESATIARLDATGTPIPGTENLLRVDAVGINHGFLPRNRLTRLAGCRHRYLETRRAWHPVTNRYGLTTRDDIYAAGDGAGIGGAHLAALQGRIAGLHAAAMLCRRTPDRHLQALLKDTEPLKRYADALFRCFGLRSGLFQIIDRDTTICRCEGVTAGRIWDAAQTGRRKLVEFKPTRMAMGPCQGRICETIVTEMLCQRGITPIEQGQLSIRPPLSPLPIAALAGDR